MEGALAGASSRHTSPLGPKPPLDSHKRANNSAKRASNSAGGTAPPAELLGFDALRKTASKTSDDSAGEGQRRPVEVQRNRPVTT